MTFVIVNYLNSQSPFETFDVREDKIIKRKSTFFEKFLRTASILSYVPTTLTVFRYLFGYRK